MVSVAEQACLICAELDGRVLLPGGMLVEGDLVGAFHLPPQATTRVYAGHLLVVPRRHAPGFGELTSDEAAAVGIAVSRLSRRLQDLGAERVYTATIGHNVDHLHVHLLPRWPETPPDVQWHAVDEWPGARLADAKGVAALSDQLRG